MNPLSPRSPMPVFKPTLPTVTAEDDIDAIRAKATAMSNANRTQVGFYPATAIRVADTKITNDLAAKEAAAAALRAAEEAQVDAPAAGQRTPRQLANPVIMSLAQKM